MNKLVALIVFATLVSPPVFQLASEPSTTSQLLSDTTHDVRLVSSQSSDRPTDGSGSLSPLSPENVQRNLEGPIDADDIATASSWASSSGITDWLGPLAPLALSPFFGVTCLSGLSLWGPSWISDNSVIGVAGPLGHEWLFFIFLTLTLLTSIPRLTKVSKPFAQAVDRLETYAVIIILLTIKFVMTMDSPSRGIEGDEAIALLEVPVMHFGILSMSLDTLLSIAMAINILVINSVKFFFEFLIWLTPVPFMDAIFEICNKSLCAALMAVYAFSPTIATAINLLLLLVAALMLRWISRRVRFYRTMILDPILSRLWTGFGTPKSPELIVFPQKEFGPFPAKSRLRLLHKGEEGWSLGNANWWLPEKLHPVAPGTSIRVIRGWVMHTIEINDGQKQCQLRFSRRYSDEALVELLEQMGIAHDRAEEIVQQDRKVEFA